MVGLVYSLLKKLIWPADCIFLKNNIFEDIFPTYLINQINKTRKKENQENSFFKEANKTGKAKNRVLCTALWFELSQYLELTLHIQRHC